MTNCTRCGGTPSPACDNGPCEFAAVEGEREAFDEWAKPRPYVLFADYAWQAWQARAAVDTGDALESCKGKNCTSTDGTNHSPECIAQHEATIDGKSPEQDAERLEWMATHQARIFHSGYNDGRYDVRWTNPNDNGGDGEFTDWTGLYDDWRKAIDAALSRDAGGAKG